MATLATLAKKRTIKMLCVGYPGTGKTGSLAALANAGYNLRIADFDGNYDSLIAFCSPEAMERVEIVSLEDKLKPGERVMETVTPNAYSRFNKLIANWSYEVDGVKIDHGPVRSWGPNDILVVDSLTALGDAAMRRVLAMNNHTTLNRQESDWGTAQAEQDAAMQLITGQDIPCHVIVTAHLQLIAPKEPTAKELKEGSINVDIKEQIAELVPAKLFPNALGRKLSPLIGQHFPYLVLFEEETVNGQAKRVIRTQPTPAVNVKVPIKGIAPKLPVSSGLLTIFQSLRGESTQSVEAA